MGLVKKKTKIAILYICTGKYICFWEDFFKSFEEKFIVEEGIEKHYFVFTDSNDVYGADVNDKIHIIYQENLGWPGNTLYRFRMFNGIADRIKDFDYTFFMNANVICVQKVSSTDFLPKEEGLLVVQHPGFFANRPYEYTYDRNRNSRAFIPFYKGKYYVCGGVNGGKTQIFLKVINELMNRVDDDWSRGVVALWHDESHLNRYIIDYPKYKMLSPSYCYPEGWNIPFEPILVVRDKSKYINVEKIKTSPIKNTENSKRIIEKIDEKIQIKIAKVLYGFMGR